MEKTVFNYYQNLAKDYDDDRFGNTYGRFIHAQEANILKKWLSNDENQILDLGCGTGRLSSFATHGTDISPKMIQMAQQKHPNKAFTVANASQLGYADEYFDTVFSAHVFMHLSPQHLKKISQEVHRILTPKGSFIFDFPSQKRRKLLGVKPDSWHGGTSYAIDEIQDLMGQQWRLKRVHGVLFLPIHRFPNFLRQLCLPLDNGLCQSKWREYASYQFVEFEKLGA